MTRSTSSTPLAALAAASIALAALAACGSDDVKAVAALKDQNGADFGTATFTQPLDGPTTVELKVATTSTMATAGAHGVHIHAAGFCEPPTFSSAMGHWNPTMMMHGNPAAGPHHGGDLGNLMIGADRSGTLSLTTSNFAVTSGSPNSVLFLAVIVHANPDDYVTQMPPGNAGPRIACGVIHPEVD